MKTARIEIHTDGTEQGTATAKATAATIAERLYNVGFTPVAVFDDEPEVLERLQVGAFAKCRRVEITTKHVTR